jgi:hypothetical protein
MPGIAQQKIFGSANQTLLFTMVDAGGGRALPIMGALAYFHEHQRLIIQYDQVDFPGTATKIAQQQF